MTQKSRKMTQNIKKSKKTVKKNPLKLNKKRLPKKKSLQIRGIKKISKKSYQLGKRIN